MKSCLDLRGIVTVLNTPFRANGEIDPTALRRNARNAIDACVAGFLFPALASEVEKLSLDERDALVDALLEETQGRVPVIGGASAPTSEERVRLARRLVKAGCAGVLAAIPFTDEVGYVHAVHELAEAQPGFLMLQDWDPNGAGVPVEVFLKLFEEVECFLAVKVEVVPAGWKYTELLRATDGRLHVSGGWAVMQMIEALDRGVHAFMPTGMHAIYTRIYSLYEEGKRDAARDLFNRILPVLAFSNQRLDISILFFKKLLHAQGVYPSPFVRPPSLPLDEFQSRISDELIEHAIQLEAEVSRTERAEKTAK